MEAGIAGSRGGAEGRRAQRLDGLFGEAIDRAMDAVLHQGFAEIE